MGEIPEDIDKVASALACQMTSRCAGQLPGEKHSASCNHKAEFIAEAILAERKRCADVAMKEARDFVEHRMVEVSYGATCAAKAIMNGGS